MEGKEGTAPSTSRAFQVKYFSQMSSLGKGFIDKHIYIYKQRRQLKRIQETLESFNLLFFFGGGKDERRLEEIFL